LELTTLGIDDIWLAQNIMKGIIIPLLLTSITLFINSLFSKYVIHAHVKGVYKNFLIQYSRQVCDLFDKLYKYKIDTSMIIRFLLFIYGILAGVFFYFILVQCFLYISQSSFFNDMLPFSLYYNYLNADDVVTKNTYTLYIVSFFNIFSIVAIILNGSIIEIIDLRGYLYPKYREDLSLLFWSKISYYFYYFLIGMLVGINLLILLFSIGAVASFHSPNQNLSFSLVYFIDILANLITQVPTLYVILIIICYAVGICLSMYQIYLFFIMSIGFSVMYKHKITSFYINDLPHIHIKTECGETSGQLKNMQDKSLMILSENDVIKAIRWDKIKMMEIKNKDENSKMNLITSPEATDNNKP
jgi:hypothetical protein